MGIGSRPVSFYRFEFYKTPSGVNCFTRYLQRRKDVVIAYVTSQLSSPPRLGDYKLLEWKKSGLPKSSMVRMKFATIDKSIIVKKIGTVEPDDSRNIEKNIVGFFKT